MQQVRGSFSAGDTVVGGYLVISLAGAGGMGVVYRARDLKLERMVALKFLPPEVDTSTHEKERFLREARTASSLDHPNIGVIHGIEETPDGATFIIMAFYEGQSLAEKIRSGPLPPLEAVDIAMQVACGLHVAHHHRVVHRDIKPSNVMLAEPVTGGPVPNGVVKIVDFGLAQIISDRTASGTGIEGTVRYMAPEQSVGGTVDHTADQWALGVVLAEMLTGVHPFECETVGATFAAILNKPPMLEGVPLELQRIIYKALAKEPTNRYAGCDEMMRDLAAVRPLLAGAEAVPAPPRSGMWRPTSGKSWRTATAHHELALASGSSATIAAERTRLQMRWAIAVLGILVLLGSALSVFSRFPVAVPFVAREKHIAVLPFDNIGNNPENRILIDGLMDSLASQLSNLRVGDKPLWVIPSSEVRLRGIAEPAAAFKKLGASLVVKGSVERDGSDVHLTVNLIDARTLRQIGSAELDDPSGDLATLENDAVARLAGLMDASSPALSSSRQKAGTNAAPKPVAYEEYLTALAYMDRYDKPSNLDLAINSLKRAVKADPGFTIGFAQLGEAYRLKYQADEDTRWLTEAEQSCRRALELDTTLPAAYATLGAIHSDAGKHDLALQEFQQALKLDPTNIVALESLGRAYEHYGRTDDADAAFRKAIALKPSNWTTYNELGRFEQRQSKYTSAIDDYKRALQVTPDNAFILVNLGGAYADTSDPKLAAAAEQALRQSLSLQPSFAAYANLGSLYLHQHRFEEAAAATRRALFLNDRNWLLWYNLADCYAWLRQPERAAEPRQHEVALLQVALRKDGSDAALHSSLAQAYAAQQQKGKALAEIELALSLAPGNDEVLETVADAYQDLGDGEQAEKMLRKAMKLGLTKDAVADDPDIQPVLQAISK